MSAITNVLRQLKERRLWPVAILLVAGLVAVPVVLAKEPAAPAPAPPTTADSGADDVLASEPIVAEAAPSDRAKRRHVLGTPKNPFAVTETPSGSDEPASSDGSNHADDPQPNSGSNPTTSTPTGGTSTPSTGSPTTPTTTPGTPASPPKTFAPGSLTIRFGDGSSSVRKTVKKLQALPSTESPVLIYLGLSRDGKSAIFLVDEGVEAVGDGDCNPAPDKCETVKLKAGETEFLDVKDETGNTTGQFQVDLIKIHKASAAAARAHGSDATRVKASRILQGVGADSSVRGATSLHAVSGL